MSDVIEKLFDVLEMRKRDSIESSYTASLYQKGVKKINSKIMEEAGEVCLAAEENNKEHLVYEICDLLYHTFVQASYNDISFSDLEKELGRRFGTSGLDEKNSRINNDT